MVIVKLRKEVSKSYH